MTGICPVKVERASSMWLVSITPTITATSSVLLVTAPLLLSLGLFAFWLIQCHGHDWTTLPSSAQQKNTTRLPNVLPFPSSGRSAAWTALFHLIQGNQVDHDGWHAPNKPPRVHGIGRRCPRRLTQSWHLGARLGTAAFAVFGLFIKLDPQAVLIQRWSQTWVNIGPLFQCVVMGVRWWSGLHADDGTRLF